MIIFREILSIIVFVLAVVGVMDSLINEVDYEILILSAIFFLVAYFLWPSKRRGKRDDDNWALEMIFEFSIELPIEIVKFIFRSIGRFFSKSDGEIDIDI